MEGIRTFIDKTNEFIIPLLKEYDHTANDTFTFPEWLQEWAFYGGDTTFIDKTAVFLIPIFNEFNQGSTYEALAESMRPKGVSRDRREYPATEGSNKQKKAPLSWGFDCNKVGGDILSQGLTKYHLRWGA